MTSFPCNVTQEGLSQITQNDPVCQKAKVCYKPSCCSNLQNSINAPPIKKVISANMCPPPIFTSWQKVPQIAGACSSPTTHTDASAVCSAFKFILQGAFTEFTPGPLRPYPQLRVHWGVSWSYGKKALASAGEGRAWDRAHARFGDRTWHPQRSRCPRVHVETTSLCLARSVSWRVSLPVAKIWIIFQCLLPLPMCQMWHTLNRLN